MTEQSSLDSLFGGQPPIFPGLEPDTSGSLTKLVSRALIAILVGWVPLLLFSLAGSMSLSGGGLGALLQDVSVHVRYLLAPPLLILAERSCGRRFNRLAHNFTEGGLVARQQLSRFGEEVVDLRRRVKSWIAGMAVFAVAYVLVLAAFEAQPIELMAAWHKTSGTEPVLSLAGWWHLLVSLPLLFTLVLRWLWRLVLLAHFLHRAARFDLQLIAVHPDRAAGLGFVAHLMPGFAMVGFAFTAIAAGSAAKFVMQGEVLPLQFLIVQGGFLLVVLGLFAAPFLVFAPVLARLRRNAIVTYGTLARRVGVDFESKWLDGKAETGTASPGQNDFSTTTDLYGLAERVQALRLVPIDVYNLAYLFGVMLIPLAVTLCLAVPSDVIFGWLRLVLLG